MLLAEGDASAVGEAAEAEGESGGVTEGKAETDAEAERRRGMKMGVGCVAEDEDGECRSGGRL